MFCFIFNLCFLIDPQTVCAKQEIEKGLLEELKKILQDKKLPEPELIRISFYRGPIFPKPDLLKT